MDREKTLYEQRHCNGEETKSVKRVAATDHKRMSIADFEILKLLGEGGYARVFRVRHKATDTIYAMKVIIKEYMKKAKKEYEVKVERDVLVKLSHPNIIKLHYCFRDEEKLYFVLEEASNGDLFSILHKLGTIPLELGRFYAAEIVSMLEYMHSKGVVHRDLKPENILLDSDYHLKLADFGTAKLLWCTSEGDELAEATKKAKFVGTAEYVSPEVLMDKDSTPASDLWALGCIIYQFFAGRPPFREKTEYLTFDSILKGSITYPKGFPSTAKKLCERLLAMDPMKRLGSGSEDSALGYSALKKHEFFEGIDFAGLSKIKPPLDQSLRLSLHLSKDGLGGSVALEKPEEKFSSFYGSQVDAPQDLRQKAALGKLSTVDQEKVIKEGIAKKKCGWFFYNQRKLILTSRPRLSYYDPSSGEYKGDVMITKNVKAEALDSIKFIVKTPHRVYYFKGMEDGSAYDWANAINSTITTCHCEKRLI